MLPTFAQASRGHLARLDKLVERGSVPKLRRVYEDAVAELEAKLARAISGGASPFTVHQHRVMLAQVRQGIGRMSTTLGGSLGEHARQIQEASARAVIADIKKLERATGASATQLPIEQAARFAGVVDKRRTSLLRLNQTSMRRYGEVVVERAEAAMARSLVTGETGYQAVSRVSDAVGGEWWRAARIARTEGAWAYNATQVDAVADASEAFTDLMVRWTEMVADVTLTKLDERVGDDSCALHGQLARAGDAFGMPTVNPPHLKISESLIGQTWTNPPNRPNDRAVLQPWRPGWGWGWVLRGGSRAPAPTPRHRPR